MYKIHVQSLQLLYSYNNGRQLVDSFTFRVHANVRYKVVQVFFVRVFSIFTCTVVYSHLGKHGIQR